MKKLILASALAVSIPSQISSDNMGGTKVVLLPEVCTVIQTQVKTILICPSANDIPENMQYNINVRATYKAIGDIVDKIIEELGIIDGETVEIDINNDGINETTYGISNHTPFMKVEGFLGSTKDIFDCFKLGDDYMMCTSGIIPNPNMYECFGNLTEFGEVNTSLWSWKTMNRDYTQCKRRGIKI